MIRYETSDTTFDDLVRQFYIDIAGFDAPAIVPSVEEFEKANTIAFFKKLLFDVSSAVHHHLGRTFVPYVETVEYYNDYINLNYWYDTKAGTYRLNLDEDCISVTSVTWLGTTLTSGTDYRLDKSRESLLFSGSNIAALPDFDSKVSIAATWGYHNNVPLMWRSVATLQSSLNSTDTSFVATLATIANFETYSYIKIDNEFMFVTAVNAGAPYTITVERGVNGTTAVSHNSAVTIYKYQQMANVAQEIRRLVIRAYSLRDASRNVYVSGEEIRELVETEFSLNIAGRVLFGIE